MPQKHYGKNQRTMEDVSDISGEVTVVDVYDIASDIGKECEKIIDQYGADAVTSLMPKVISALELLENLATRNELENTQVLELQVKISQLENDKIEKQEYRQKFEMDLEVIEDQWRTESKDLVSMVSRLQEENRRLMKEQTSPSHAAQLLSPDAERDDGCMMQRLKDTIEKQRDDIRIKEKSLQEKCGDLDNLKAQVDRLSSSTREARRKQKLLQTQVRNMCDERADFLVQLQDQQRDLSALKQRLGLAQKENEDLVKLDFLLPTNKAIFDLDDPNRPRFTTQELKDILHERNELKARVSDLEDELEAYRPKNKIESIRKLIPLVEKIENACDNLLNANKFSCNSPQPLTPTDEDAPVQGPLPYEPDDAPWKRGSESKIRKFFRNIFTEGGSGSSFPRRSLSTLSKMALSATSDPVPV